MLSKRSLEVLHLMIEAEDREDYDAAEIVCDGIRCYLDESLVSRSTVKNLVQHVAVSLASEPGSLERYVVSGTGRKIAENPEVADKVVASMLAGIPCDAAGNPLPKDNELDT